MDQEEKPLHLETSKEKVIWEFVALSAGIFLLPCSFLLLIVALSDISKNFWHLVDAIIELYIAILCLRRKW